MLMQRSFVFCRILVKSASIHSKKLRNCLIYDAVKRHTVLSFNNFTRSECLSVSVGAPSVIIFVSPLMDNHDLFKLIVILLNKSFPVVVSLRDSMDKNTSGTSKFPSSSLNYE